MKKIIELIENRIQIGTNGVNIPETLHARIMELTNKTWPERKPQKEWGKEWIDIKKEILLLNMNEKIFLGARIMISLTPERRDLEKNPLTANEKNFFENPLRDSLGLVLKNVPAQKVRLVYMYLYNFMTKYTMLPIYKD